MKYDFEYDKARDSLAIHKGGPAHGSARLGEIILDFDKDKQIIGVEILNPDKLLGITKKALSNLSDAKIMTRQRGDCVYVYLVLKIKFEEKARIMPLPLGLEQPHARSAVVAA